MAFFGVFPKTTYNFPGRTDTEVVDIFRSAISIDKGIDSAAAYQVYNLGDQRPDQLSEELYGNVEFHWTFFAVNKHLRNGWPLSYAAYTNYIDEEYNGFALTLYRTDINFAPVSGNQLPGDEPEYNSIAGKFAIGSVIQGVGRAAIITSGDPIPEVPASGATAEVIGRSSDTNTLYFRYTSENTFNADEEFFVRGPTNDTYNIFDKYIITSWVDAPHHFEINGEIVTNPTNLDYTANKVSFNTYEQDLNDSNKSIRVIRAEYIEDFVIAYRKAINGQ